VVWVKLDDQFPIHRKIAKLSDPAFRLHAAAIAWCARNLTDGVVPADELDDVCAQVRAPERFATELADRKVNVWHTADYDCPSPHCSAPALDEDGKPIEGWVIHDYLEYQPARSKVLRIKKARIAAGAEGGRRSGESRNRSSAQARTKREAKPKQVASNPLEPRPVPLRGNGAAGPPPSSGSAAYGDRPTPGGVDTPSNGGGPAAPPENPANTAEQPRNPHAQAAWEAIQASRGKPYRPPDLD
jgi:hypothetical protein